MSAAAAIALVWQSTLLLGLGALASLAYRQRPARGHYALLLAALLTLTFPVLALGVGTLGWGLLPAPSPAPLVTPSALPSGAQDSAEPTLPFELLARGGAPAATVTTPALRSEPANAAPPDTPAASLAFSLSSLPWRRIALATWAT
ncbi:MAG TPA: hypothetical protein VFF36_15105, partial [Planctomycetota bacterium]|nr:hypothetical protein [Planctomycetota bacterium]